MGTRANTVLVAVFFASRAVFAQPEPALTSIDREKQLLEEIAD